MALRRLGLSGLSSSSNSTRLLRILGAFAQVSNHKFYQHEPDGLDDGPEIPEYDILNIRFRGYDFTVLESYSKYVHNLVQNMDIESEAHPVPPRKTQIQTFKPRSEVVDSVYNLAVYERVVKVMDVPSTRAQTLLEVIRTNLPEGVDLSVRDYSEDEEEFRYLPDHEMDELRDQLDEIEKEREARRKK